MWQEISLCHTARGEYLLMRRLSANCRENGWFRMWYAVPRPPDLAERCPGVSQVRNDNFFSVAMYWLSKWAWASGSFHYSGNEKKRKEKKRKPNNNNKQNQLGFNSRFKFCFRHLKTLISIHIFSFLLSKSAHLSTMFSEAVSQGLNLLWHRTIVPVK